MIITIDGPTASGKSSVAQAIAHHLHFYYLNTGYLYRALAYILKRDYSYSPEQLQHAREDDVTDVLGNLVYTYEQGSPHLVYKKHEITHFLKTPVVDQGASLVSASPVVRTLLLAFQRAVGEQQSLVVDGRDCGSVVFPHADIKIFLTAAPEVRASRWQHEMATKGKQFTLEESLAQITERDRRDQERAVAPLIVPPDAYVIDNSALNLEQTIEKILQLLEII